MNRSLPLAACRKLSPWTAAALCCSCARFGYDVSALDRGDDASVSVGGSAGSGGAAAGAGGAAGSPAGGRGGAGSGSGGASGPGEPADAGDALGGLLDAGAGDAGALEPCMGGGAFGPVVALGGLPAPPLFGPSLSADGRTLFFAASGDIFFARRAQVNDTTFTDVTPVLAVNSALPELTPHVSRDGRILFFSRDTDGTGFFRDLMASSRPARDAPFGSPAALGSLNDPLWSELSPMLRADGRELWFSSSRPGGPGLFDIWRSRRSLQDGQFDDPEPVGSLSTAADDSGATLTSDALTVVVSSARTGTLGSRDLWIATRPTPGDDFASVTNLIPLNTPQNDTDPAWRSDNRELLFASDRTGDSLLYSAVRGCGP